MTKVVNTARLVAIALLAVLGGCVQESEPEFCRDHRLFHSEHLADVATLTVNIDAEGNVHRDLRLPEGLMLDDPEADYVQISLNDEGGVRQLDVSLFDSLPDLQEVEVDVTTVATQKHFVINRQCASPLFRLD